MKKNIFDHEIETSRLLLRRLKISDVNDMYEYTSNPIVCKYLDWDPHTSIVQTKKFLDQEINKYDVAIKENIWGIEFKTDCKLIGVVRVYDYSVKDKRIEVSAILNPAYQGKGIMMEAFRAIMDFCFNTLNLNRIQVRYVPSNIASEKLCKNLGMSYEGLMKKYYSIKGIFEDAVLYAVTEETYRNQINQ